MKTMGVVGFWFLFTASLAKAVPQAAFLDVKECLLVAIFFALLAIASSIKEKP